MASRIPESAQLAVRQRERYLCLRCGGKGTDWHHRRRRGVRDEHSECSCNGVLMCSKDHAWMHQHPGVARELGFILSSWTELPGEHPVTNSFGQQVLLTCTGTYGGQH